MLTVKKRVNRQQLVKTRKLIIKAKKKLTLRRPAVVRVGKLVFKKPQYKRVSKLVIRAHNGPQEEFLASPADIVIYGGGAGGGKTYGLLLKPLRHLNNPHFASVIFRRTYPEIKEEGSLWDTAMQLYPLLGGKPRETDLSFRWPNGFTISFSHLQHEKDVHKYQGAQFPDLNFDELTHFSKSQFFYLISRARSAKSGVPPQVCGTCNPDPDSWLREFLDWWIGPDGYPIPERNGKLRYFIRDKDEIIWADDPDDLPTRINKKTGRKIRPKSVTFIKSTVEDNPSLLETDDYISFLESLPMVERERLLKGNWDIRRTVGTFFKREFFPVVEDAPAEAWENSLWYWDRAATEKDENNPDPDWTVGVRMGKHRGIIYVLDVVRFRGRPKQVLVSIKTTASQNPNLPVCLEQDPGSAGVAEIDSLATELHGYNIIVNKVAVDKETRAIPFSAQAELGNVRLVRGKWNKTYIDEHCAFPTKGVHDDQVDASSGAYSTLTKSTNPRILSAA
jgi:predicted phage terminase large subunit-like protein